MIRDYNNAHPDGEYFMEIINYTNQQDTGKSAEDMLKMDIVSGSAPDLITTTLNGIDLNGYCLDLYEYIDKDPDISREDFIPNILDAISQDGKLPFIIPIFEIKTMITKAKFPYIKRNWSNNIYDFVDYEKGKCSFDSPDFINMLDLFRDEHLGLTQEEHENFDYENYQREDPMDISNEKILTPGVYRMMDFQQIWTFMSYFDDAELQRYKDFVYDAAKNYYRSDSELEAILYVELNTFFNSGRSAKETAELIQNRASIYISEIYG